MGKGGGEGEDEVESHRDNLRGARKEASQRLLTLTKATETKATEDAR